MGEYDSPARHLPFPLNESSLIQRTTEDDVECDTTSSFVWPEDPTERTLVPFYLSLNEYTVLSSAVDAGSDIAYSDDAIRVWWLWTRNMRCKVPICSLIIDCITNDVDTQQAIVNMLMSNETFNNYLETRIDALTTGLISEKLIAGECDEGVVFGKVKAMVDHMNKANVDFFEKIEVGTNDEEKFASVLEGIPLLDELPIGDVIDFGQDILEDFAENYDAQVDADLLQEWYCGLWCKAMSRADCSLTYGDIFDFFQNRVSSSLTLGSTLADFVNFIRFGDFSTGTRVADGMMALQAGLVRTGRSFTGMSLPTLGYATRDAVSSSGWEDCDVCPEDDLWLVPVLAGEDTIELVSQDDDTQTWLLHNYTTGHYLTGGALSRDSLAFYILEVDYTPVETGPDARFLLDFSTRELDDVPCFEATTKIWIYNALPGSDVIVTIARLPCRDIWLAGRTDSGFAGVTTTVVFVGATATGGSIYDVTSNATTGPNGIGVNTLEEDLTTLKHAYLKTAVVLGVGGSIVSHYHEQFDSIGSGAGASGTVPSKRWAFYLSGDYGQTIRLTFEANPY